jgi:hypothetical protein
VFSGALAAQLPPGQSHPSTVAEVPFSLGNGNFTRLEVLEYRPPGWSKDAVAMRGGTPFLVDGLGIHNFLQLLGFPVTATDFVVVPGANPTNSALDAVLITEPTAGVVTLAWWDPATETTQMYGYAVAQWQGASQLTAVADATGVEIAGVASDGKIVLRGRFTPGTGGSPGTFTHVSAATINRTVLDLALADDNGDTVLEAFFLSDLGVHVFSRPGAYVRTVLGHHPGGAITKLGDRIAWLRRNVANSRYELIFVTGAGGITNWPTITHDGEDFAATGICPGNFDKTDDPDLLISQSTTQQALCVRLSAIPGTLNADVTVLDLTATPDNSGAGNTCNAAVGDFDGDGYDDMATALFTGVQLSIVRGVGVRNGAAVEMDWFLNPWSVFDYGTFEGTLDNEVPEGLYLRLNHNDTLFGGAFSHVFVQMWWQESATSLVTGGVPVRAYEYWIAPPDENTVCHSLYLPLVAPSEPQWNYGRNGFFHLQVVFETAAGLDDGPIFTVAGFADSVLLEAETAYMNAGLSHLGDLAFDESPAAEVVIEHPQEPAKVPPVPGRIRIGGKCRTHSISPLSQPPKSSPRTASQTQPADNNGG